MSFDIYYLALVVFAFFVPGQSFSLSLSLYIPRPSCLSFFLSIFLGIYYLTALVLYTFELCLSRCTCPSASSFFARFIFILIPPCHPCPSFPEKKERFSPLFPVILHIYYIPTLFSLFFYFFEPFAGYSFSSSSSSSFLAPRSL